MFPSGLLNSIIICALSLAVSSTALSQPRATAPVPGNLDLQRRVPGEALFLDGRDAWTLMDQRLINRRLSEQIGQQQGRMSPAWLKGPLTLAADAQTGYRIAPPGAGERDHFHGYYILDAFATLEVTDGLEVSFNALWFNPSASDGYRASSDLLTGLTMHLDGELARPGGTPLIGEFIGFDLDQVTIGQGLLIERLPIEGNAAGLRWGSWTLDQVMVGRALWQDDDVYALTLGALDRRVELTFFYWLTDSAAEGAALFTGAVDLPLTDHSRLGLEYGLRPDSPNEAPGGLSHAGMARLDWRRDDLLGGRLQMHVGYQFRAYLEGFSPQQELTETSAVPQLPFREDAYVTHSLEYLSIGSQYDQWSHTGMFEMRAALTPRLWWVGQAEGLLRAVEDGDAGPPRVVFTSRDQRVPGVLRDLFWRAGLEWRLFRDRPGRFNAFVTDKQINSGFFPQIPAQRRFRDAAAFVFELEMYL